MKRRIAVVEDETDLRANYVALLSRQGYDAHGYAGVEAAMSIFRSRLPDLVILDIGLGDAAEGGFDLCRELRAMSRTLPIIFLTARDSDFDAVSGLRLGADDYLTKDIGMPHLLARIAALFRRMEALQAGDSPAPIIAGELALDTGTMQVSWRGQAVDLTLTEYWIVHALVRIPGHVKTRTQLMDDANCVVDDATITSHVKRIRRKFREIDPDFDCIETRYGAGYRWISRA
jgi:two-component system, OmpR family, response regulator